MMILLTWFFLCLLVAGMGRHRAIGIKGAFGVSLLLSPLIGLIVVLRSEEVADEATRAMAAGERLLKKKKYDRALQHFHRALQKRPYSIAVHYKLACTYSLKNMPKEALHHLSRAFEKGYLNMQRVQNSPELDNLRNYEGFKSLAPSQFFTGFKLGNPEEDQLLAAS